MAHLFDNAPDDADYQVEPEPRRRRWVGVVGALGLAVVGVVSALLWHTWSDGVPIFPSAASEKPAAAEAAANRTVGVADFQAFQQQIAGTMQSTSQLLGAQQAEIKRLSDQIAALAARIDALQSPAASASAQAALPTAPTPAPAAPRKRPIAAKKPAPAISVGGAPLPQPAR